MQARGEDSQEKGIFHSISSLCSGDFYSLTLDLYGQAKL